MVTLKILEISIVNSDTHLNDPQNYDNQHSDTQHDIISLVTLRIMKISIVTLNMMTISIATLSMITISTVTLSMTKSA